LTFIMHKITISGVIMLLLIRYTGKEGKGRRTGY